MSQKRVTLLGFFLFVRGGNKRRFTLLFMCPALQLKREERSSFAPTHFEEFTVAICSRRPDSFSPDSSSIKPRTERLRPCVLRSSWNRPFSNPFSAWARLQYVCQSLLVVCSFRLELIRHNLSRLPNMLWNSRKGHLTGYEHLPDFSKI
jgi:hypothetical protein